MIAINMIKTIIVVSLLLGSPMFAHECPIASLWCDVYDVAKFFKLEPGSPVIAERNPLPNYEARLLGAVEKTSWSSKDDLLEFSVMLNWHERDHDISAVYLQVCEDSHKSGKTILYGTEVQVNNNNCWKVSTCQPQNDTAVVTKVDTGQKYAIEMKIRLLPKADTTLRLVLADSYNNAYGPIDIGLDDVTSGSKTVEKERLVIQKLKRQTQPVSDYIVVANELYIHQLSLDGSREKTLISGLGFAVALDYDFRQRYLYWTDKSQRTIMRSNLDGTNVATVLSQGLIQPEGIAVDWINNKLYWTDVQTRWIGVMDLNTRFYKALLVSEADASPREIAVDPTTRVLYWSEWGASVGRIKKTSMDGLTGTTVHSTGIERPYSITIDIQNQELYWADNILDKIETSSVNGTGRRVLTSTGVPQVFSLSLFGNTLYFSDWTFGVRSVNKTGTQTPTTTYNIFCNFIFAYGIRVVSLKRQPLVGNPCDPTNGGCSHFCLLSAVDDRGYTCHCPDGMLLNNDNMTCTPSTSGAMHPLQANLTGSCRRAGHTGCCTALQCNGDSGSCFCDADCHLYGDCCDDLMEICSSQNSVRPRLVFSHTLYIQRLSLDGSRTRTIHSGLNSAIGIDYDYRRSYLFWSTSNELWRSHLDGSEALLLLNTDLNTVDDIAVDWITNKLYWTDNGFDRIGVLDLLSGYYSFLVNTGSQSSPRGIIVDPVNKMLYWCDWGTQAKIEKASMDGTQRRIIHNTGLTWPNGLTLDHQTQVLYWIDAKCDRIESSYVNGSNRKDITSSNINRPFSITFIRDMLYFTDRHTIKSVPKTGGEVQTITNLCEISSGIEAVAVERQPMGINPCGDNNGGCSHICLLSANDSRGYSCACHVGFTLDPDMANCSSSSPMTATVRTPVVGTCAAAGYTSGCCMSGLCRGSPPTCSCDPQCSIFLACCSDFVPCPIGIVITTTTPGNTTLVLNRMQHTFSFRCDVDTSEVPIIQWTFTSALSSVTLQISNGIESLDPANYSVTTFPNQRMSNLTINKLRLQDAGVYTCIATTSDQSDYASSTLTIFVAPSTPVISGNTSYVESDEAVLECAVTTYPQPDIVWVKREENKGTVILDSQRTRLAFSYFREHLDGPRAVSRITISSLSTSDNGTYSCQVYTDIPGYLTASSRVTITIQDLNICERFDPCQNGGGCVDLVVGYRCDCTSTHTGQNCTQVIPTNIPAAVPNFIQTPLTMNANIATSINLTCSAEGYPPPTYQWYKDGLALPGETRSFLYIPEFLPSERGSYSCEASNSEGQMSSDSARVDISGVQQYIATLQLNQTSASHAFEEALDIITDFSDVEAGAGIYAVQVLNATSGGEAVFLVTTLTRNHSFIPIHVFIQHALESTAAVLMVTSLVRFDGCEAETFEGVIWPESNIGQVVQLPCPCDDLLQSGNLSSRTCGGSYSHGGRWINIDYSQCDAVVNQVTHSLCSIAMDTGRSAEVRSETVVNLTSQPESFKVDHVTITALVIQDLTEDAIINPEVRDNYLTTIDNLQQVDRDVIFDSETQNRSSSRLVQSLERFLDEVEVVNLNTSSKFVRQTFALQVQSIDISSLNGETFNVDLGSVAEAMNITGNIEESNLITIENAVNALSNATAAIHISDDLLEYCTRGRTNQRLGYSVFLFDTLFRNQNENSTIGSLILAARLRCGENSTHTPVNVTLLSSNELTTSQGVCSRWTPAQREHFGAWSQSDCREVVQDGNKRVCECSQLGHFGILFDVNPAPLPRPAAEALFVITCIGIVLSLVCLTIFISSYLAIKKLRTSIHGQLLISMSFSLIGLYVIFFIGGYVTVIPALCGLSSALLHYFLLVFFAWTAVEAVWLYLKLVKIFGLHSIEQQFITLTSLIAWLVPLFIVIISAGAGYRYYTSEFYCRATEWPFWFGLLLPLLAIYLFNWIMFTVIIVSICKHMNSISKKASADIGATNDETRFNTKNLMIAVVLSITFGLGWGFGFLATSHDIEPIVITFQAIFTVVVGFQGVLLFILHGARSPEVQSLWKSMLLGLSRKTRKVYSFTQSTSETKTGKLTSITKSPSTDLLTNSSAVKSPSVTFSIDTVDTKIDIEPNPAYGDVKFKFAIAEEEKIAVSPNTAYETVKHSQ